MADPKAAVRAVGLISGTSADGIDAALIELSGQPDQPQVTLLAGQTIPYDAALQQRIWAVCAGEALSMADLAIFDDAIARAFAQAAIAIQVGQPAAHLIGSHGQTVYHRPRRLSGESPENGLAYSLQLGRGAAIAHYTGLPTVADFRQGDIASGGEGAPLVPALDALLLLHPTQWRCVQNIGGIGNVTYLPPTGSPEPVLGWDTGPGNSLLDLAVQRLSGGEQLYDHGGSWAAKGTICAPLLNQWLGHPFFALPPPKSTGRELFGWEFLQRCLAEAEAHNLEDADVLATLTELTAASIARSYGDLPHPPHQVLLCGGGRHNRYLVSRLQQHLPAAEIVPTDAAGLNADYKEAIAFGLLAYWRYHGVTSNVPSVTGAARFVSLGDLYWPPSWPYDREDAPKLAMPSND